MDKSDPDITFDQDGVCHHVERARHRLAMDCFRGPDAAERLGGLVDTIKREGRGKPYDCVIGVSGGTDSSVAILRAKDLGLKPLAVHLDNGWNSGLAVANIERVLRALDVDLYTYVVDWEEIKDLQRALFRGSVPNVEVATDHAIVATLYREAARRDIRFILTGSNVEGESIMPDAWGYDGRDARHIVGIHRQFGTLRTLKSFPLMYPAEFLWYICARRIRLIPILNYGPSSWPEEVGRLKSQFGWVPYPRKHGESRFTRFFQEYYLPEKFGFDKRKAHYSSLIVANQMSREQALVAIDKPLMTPQEREIEIQYVTKKLAFSRQQWDQIMQTPPRSFRDYPNNAWMFNHASPLTQFVRRLAKHELAAEGHARPVNSLGQVVVSPPGRKRRRLPRFSWWLHSRL